MEPLKTRHSRGVNSTSASADSGLPTFGEGGNPAVLFNMPLDFVLAAQGDCSGWIPAFAEMAKFEFLDKP